MNLNLRGRIPVPNVLSLFVIVLLAENYFSPFADLDFAWQVRTGEEIVRTGNLRVPDQFSYTIAGTVVPDFEWFYEVILYLTWHGFGFGGLKFLRVLLVSLPILLMALHLRRQGVRWHGIALALLAAVIVLAGAWNLRPLYCTSIGLLLVSGWLHDHCTGRRPLPWALPLVMLLWANTHPGVIVGQGLLGGAIAWEWLNCRLKLNMVLDRRSLRRLTLIAGLGLLATLLSPNPLERLLYPFQPELRHPIMRMFAEMNPLYSFIGTAPAPVLVTYLIAGLVAGSVIVRFRHYRLWEVALLAGLAVLGNLAVRSLQDWLLVMLSLGVPHLAALLAEAARADRRRAWVNYMLRVDSFCKRTLGLRWLRFQAFWPGAAVALLLAVSVVPAWSRNMPVQNAPEWPVAAVDFIEVKGLHGCFFSPPDYGSFLTWRLGGLNARARIYADTRGFFFPPLLLEDSHLMPQLTPDWRRRLDRVLDDYPTDYFLLETTGARSALWRHLEPHIGTPLYCDDISVLLSARQVREALRCADTLLAGGE
jgi:hypothetical protein